MAPEAATPAYSLALEPTKTAGRAGFLQRVWRVGRQRPPALVGALVVLAFAVMAVGAPWLAGDDPLRTDWKQVRKAPTLVHLFGTDDLGRDNFARGVGFKNIAGSACRKRLLREMLCFMQRKNQNSYVTAMTTDLPRGFDPI